MAEFQFELRPFFREGERGREGVVGPFGNASVAARYRKPSIKAAHGQHEVRLHGERMPQVVYQTVGPGRPTLHNARLTVDGHPVDFSFNSRALRNTSRALRLTYRDYSYEYVVTGFARGATLSRSGVRIRLTFGRNPAGLGVSTFGTVTGEAVAADLALALIFEEVDTLELTVPGAVTESLTRVFFPRTHELV